MALLTGSGPEIRVTVPSLRRAVKALSPTAAFGPRTKSRGRACVFRAAWVAAGTSSWATKSTGSPDFAAQAAAGMPYLGWSAATTTTASLGLPLAAARKRSTAAASENGSAPAMRSVLRSLGSGGADPTATIWLPAASWEPVGFRADSAAAVASGSLPPSESRSGARTGAAMRAEAAVAARQSPWSARATAGGRVATDWPGKTERATPAASVTGSAPPTRVVFLVAKAGKPSESGALDCTTTLGGRVSAPPTNGAGLGPPPLVGLSPPPQAPRADAATTRSSRAPAGRGDTRSNIPPRRRRTCRLLQADDQAAEGAAAALRRAVHDVGEVAEVGLGGLDVVRAAALGGVLQRGRDGQV